MAAVELKPALGVALDTEPDARGNLMTAALVQGGRRIALTLNAN